MKYVGAHVSIAGGIYKSISEAMKISATAMAIFTKSQRRWFGKDLTDIDITKFKDKLKDSRISSDKILPHAGYLINLANPDDDKVELSRKSFIHELKRCEQLGLPYLNIHPGSHLGKLDENNALQRIAESINIAISQTENVTVVVENTSGQGNYLGRKFEHLAEIIEQIEDKSRIGVCLDSCHLFGGGYDLRSEEKYENLWKQFDEIVGFEYLKGMHLNDSKIELGSRKDRHASIGEGKIGTTFFQLLMLDKRLDEIPLILETPNPERYRDEIELLHSWEKN